MLVTPSKRKPSKLIFFQPVADVAEQEALDFVLGVIEQQRIPGGMLAARAAVEYW